SFKVAKNARPNLNQSPPVRALKDPSAVDAFRSRSISVSDHAAHRANVTFSARKIHSEIQTFIPCCLKADLPPMKHPVHSGYPTSSELILISFSQCLTLVWKPDSNLHHQLQPGLCR
ncbi:hypothetical protein E2320_011910, partial [Naja naja]